MVGTASPSAAITPNIGWLHAAKPAASPATADHRQSGSSASADRQDWWSAITIARTPDEYPMYGRTDSRIVAPDPIQLTSPMVTATSRPAIGRAQRAITQAVRPVKTTGISRSIVTPCHSHTNAAAT